MTERYTEFTLYPHEAPMTFSISGVVLLTQEIAMWVFGYDR